MQELTTPRLLRRDLNGLQRLVPDVSTLYSQVYLEAFGGRSSGPSVGRSSDVSDPTGEIASCGCDLVIDGVKIGHRCLPGRLREAHGEIQQGIELITRAKNRLDRAMSTLDKRGGRDIETPSDPKARP